METQASPATPPLRSKLFRRVIENPVILKELRGRMRGRQAFWLLTGYLALLGLVSGLIYLSAVTTRNNGYYDSDIGQEAGKAIFGTVVLMELFMITMIAPALTAGGITSEREHQTFDLLRTTTLSARSFVLGKLGSSLAYLLLLVFAALPIESIAFVLGGVGLAEILVSSLLLVVTAVFYCSLGIFFSSFMKRTAGASVVSYVTIVLSYVLLVLAFFLMFITSSAYPGNNHNHFWEDFTSITAFLLTSTNPLLTAAVSEVNLVESQKIFLFSIPLASGQSIDLLSPWIPFTLLHSLLALLLNGLSVRFVRRPDR